MRMRWTRLYSPKTAWSAKVYGRVHAVLSRGISYRTAANYSSDGYQEKTREDQGRGQLPPMYPVACPAALVWGLLPAPYCCTGVVYSSPTYL